MKCAALADRGPPPTRAAIDDDIDDDIEIDIVIDDDIPIDFEPEPEQVVDREAPTLRSGRLSRPDA